MPEGYKTSQYNEYPTKIDGYDFMISVPKTAGSSVATGNKIDTGKTVPLPNPRPVSEQTAPEVSPSLSTASGFRREPVNVATAPSVPQSAFRREPVNTAIAATVAKSGYTPVPKNFSGRMEGLNFAAPEEQAPNLVAPATTYTPVAKNFSGRMEGLNFTAPQAAPAPEVPIVQTNPIPIPKKKPIISLPPGAIPYKGNWTNAPKYIMPNQDRWGASRNDNNRIDRTARNGQATTKVNPYEPGTEEYLLWEEQYGAAQTGNVAATGTTSGTGTFGSTAKDGGLVRGYGRAVRGRKGVRFI
jgi:hypothetical protein